MLWIAGLLAWMALGLLFFRWFFVALGPKTPEEQRRDDDDQARALDRIRDAELIEAALVDCFGEDAIRIKAQTDRRVTVHPRSLPGDMRRVG